MLRTIYSRIVGATRRGRLEQESDQEIQSHLQLLAERFVRNGMDPEEAAHAARRGRSTPVEKLPVLGVGG